MMEILTRRLKEARLSKKYTQEDLGKLIKVQKSQNASNESKE